MILRFHFLVNIIIIENVVIVQSLSCIRLFTIPWTAACQAFLSLTISWSLPKFMSIESVMPSNQHSELISFRMDWFDVLEVQESSPTPLLRSINSLVLSFLYSPSHIHTSPVLFSFCLQSFPASGSFPVSRV